MLDLAMVAGFLRETAAAEVLPRFGQLAATDIREKGPGDLVTVADEAAERRLSALLENALPGSVTLGEEGVAADRSRFALLDGAAPVWVIDPIDGTGNYAKGRPGFAMIIACVIAGVVEGGWIYDPLGDVMAVTRRGDGAWLDGVRVRLAEPTGPPVGSGYGRAPSGVRMAQALHDSGKIAAVNNRGCSGLEYIEILQRASHFTLHSRALAWDHAAGMLLIAEAGGEARFLDGSAYDPRQRERAPLAASSAAVWRLVRDIATAPVAGSGA